MNMQRRFEARDIQRLLGTNRNRLFYWIHTHRFLVPGIAQADGTGKRAIFSAKNLVELAVIKALVEFGTDLRLIKDIKKLLDKNDEQFEGRNAFDFALKHHKEVALKIQLFRPGKKQIRAKVLLSLPSPGAELKGEDFYLTPLGAEFFLNEGKDEHLDMGHVSIQIDIGEIVKELLSKMS